MKYYMLLLSFPVPKIYKFAVDLKKLPFVQEGQKEIRELFTFTIFCFYFYFYSNCLWTHVPLVRWKLRGEGIEGGEKEGGEEEDKLEGNYSFQK